MVVRVIDIGGIDDRHYYNFHFIITFEHGNQKPNWTDGKTDRYTDRLERLMSSFLYALNRI